MAGTLGGFNFEVAQVTGRRKKLRSRPSDFCCLTNCCGGTVLAAVNDPRPKQFQSDQHRGQRHNHNRPNHEHQFVHPLPLSQAQVDPPEALGTGRRGAQRR